MSDAEYRADAGMLENYLKSHSKGPRAWRNLQFILLSML